MLVKEILNEFELDTAQAITRCKNIPLNQLKGKHIIVDGLENYALTRAIIASFLYLNDTLQLEMKVSVYLNNDEREHHLKTADELLSRDDVSFLLDENTKIDADFIILSELCNNEVSLTSMASYQEKMQTLFKRLVKPWDGKVILLSDFRSYGSLPSNFVAAEMEIVDEKTKSLVYEIEKMVRRICKEQELTYVILRSAMLVGSGDWNRVHPLQQVLHDAREGKATIGLTTEKASYIYINDLLLGMYQVLFFGAEGECYNVVGKDCTVDTFTLASAIYKNSKDKENLTIEIEKNKVDGIALDGAKLFMLGYEPQIPFEDMIALFMKSKNQGEKRFVFEDTYNGKLEGIQSLMLEVMSEIDRICKKYNIQYFLGGGTLLGAIRHNGFIPWDDDADLMMRREEYERFVEVAPKELPSHFILQTAKTDPENHFFSKIRVKNTQCATEFTKKFPNMETGFFVDIFPHDYTANSGWGQKLHRQLTILTRSLVFNKWGKTYVKGDGSHKVYRFFATILKTILPMSVLEYLQFKTITFFEHKKNKQYMYDGMGQNLKRGVFPEEWLKEAIYVEFEGRKFPVPKAYDEYLTFLYGEYMEWIPVSQRKNSHTIYLMDLGTHRVIE